ncbi:DUF5320 domain-containing protein [Candidatus Harpocratesius sp.]
MPYGDRTGPNGLGPRTGRGLGFCNGYPQPGYANPVGYSPYSQRGFGRGGGYGRGGGWGRSGGYGRGYRHWAPIYDVYPPIYPPTSISPEDQKKTYELYIQNLEKQLNDAKKHLENFEKDNE